MKIEGFEAILELIQKYNIFNFDRNFFLQKKGIAMGSKAGPSIANIFVYILEQKWLDINKPLYYKRFIDDIFVTLEIMKKKLILYLMRWFFKIKFNN